MSNLNEETTCLAELETMFHHYDGSAPFAEWAKAYIAKHPSQFDLSTIVKYIHPTNEPTNKPQPIRRMVAQIDECLPTPLFYEVSKSQASETPLEIEEEGTRYHLTDCYLVPALNSTIIYTIGVYSEIVEGEHS